MTSISLHRLKQTILHKINPDKCKYILLEKINDTNISNYKNCSVNIPALADSFTLVTIGKRDNESFRKYIISFYHGKNIIQRLIEDLNGTRIIREYEYLGKNTNSNTRYKKIVQKKYNPVQSKFVTDLIEEHKTYKSSKTKKIKLQINKNIIEGNKIISTVTEYPFNRSKKIIHSLKKVLGLEMELGNGLPVITGTFETANVKFPQADKFLPYRFIIDTKMRLKELTKYFIYEKNLEKLGIKIEFTDMIAKNSSAHFSEKEGKIAYNINNLGKLPLLAAHEVEHAYQFSQIGRLGKGHYLYGKNSRRIMGKIDNIKESMEANKYVVASENYPKLTDEEDLSKNLDYQNNYLEIKAKEAGKRAIDEYEKLGKELSSQFIFGV